MKIFSPHDRLVTQIPLQVYKFIFGLTILLELLFHSNGIIHVIYENWEPAFVPIFRSLGIPVTERIIEFCLYSGITLASLLACDSFPDYQGVVAGTLAVVYGYLRVCHYYQWNNHYYLNILVLLLFAVMGGGEGPVPRWKYQSLQSLFAIVYVLAGVSKMSTAWLSGVITDSMADGDGTILPSLVLAWAGLALDLGGGLVLLFCVWRDIPKHLLWLTHSAFVFFHLHNLFWLFKSIQFFPVHMLGTTALFLRLRPQLQTAPKKRFRVFVCALIIGGQAMFALRRFVILVDYPWQIVAANDRAEFHFQAHHFSWRMKARTSSSSAKIRGFWPYFISIGMRIEAKSVRFMNHTSLFPVDPQPDPELILQATTRRYRPLMDLARAKNFSLSFHLCWWAELNRGPFQLIINPQVNVAATPLLPLWGAPSPAVVEEQIPYPSNWVDLISEAGRFANRHNDSFVPFLSRDFGEWIPNPLIAADTRFMPTYIMPVFGKVSIRIGGSVTAIERLTPLPGNGDFHVKSEGAALWVLGFID